MKPPQNVTQLPPLRRARPNTMNFPAWKKSSSRWLQTTKGIENPFMGKAMISYCDLVNTAETAK
jgi:hypothetical protein